VSRVVVVGSANVDIAVRVPRLPVPGETVLGSEAATLIGGKGANQAVAARRLGADTVLVAAVGDDRFGDDVRAALAREGLPAGHLITVNGAATGVALIVVDAAGENTVVVAPGANGRLDGRVLDRLPALLDPDAVLLLQLEIPLPACLAAARDARRAGARVVLNAAPLPEAADAALAELLQEVDILVVNEGEAARLGGHPAGSVEWVAAAAGLCDLGPKTCVVTLGARGAVSADGAEAVAQAAFPVDAVDTTGAGDAFCGALAAALAGGAGLDEALRRACAAGAIATTRMGAQSAMPTAAELDAFLAARKGHGHA
jgi:ribokinase